MNSTNEARPVRGRRRTLVGVVVSNKMDKSAVIRVDRYVKHPQYKKRRRLSTRFIIHDPNNELQVGDTVRVMETRPLSKKKRFRLVEIIEKAK